MSYNMKALTRSRSISNRPAYIVGSFALNTGGNATMRNAKYQRTTAGPNARSLIFSINQLGGVGGRGARNSRMYASNADGVRQKHVLENYSRNRRG